MRPFSFFPVVLAACLGCSSSSAPVGVPDAGPAAPALDAAPGADASSLDGEPPPGGECTFDKVPGVVTITDVGPATDAACTASRTVRFDFVGDDPSRAASDPTPSYRRLGVTVDFTDYDPPASCLADRGVAVGATFRASRWALTRGTCVPIQYQVAWDPDRTCETAIQGLAKPCGPQ